MAPDHAEARDAVGATRAALEASDRLGAAVGLLIVVRWGGG